MRDSPLRIQRRRVKGWRMPPNTVSATRPGALGNPFTIGPAAEAGYLSGPKDPNANAFLVNCFRDWLGDAGANGGRDWWQGPKSDDRKAEISRRLPSLRGKNLACFCALCEAHAAGRPLNINCTDCTPCHVDVLGQLANYFICEAA